MDQSFQKIPSLGVLLAEVGAGLDRQPQHAERVLEGLEEVVGRVELDEEAVGEYGQGRNDGKDNFADGLVDEGEVGNVCCVGEG